MSVILEDNQKFCSIYDALVARNGRDDIRYFFGHHGNDALPLTSNIAVFVGKLHLANVWSYNARYTRENEQPRSFNLAGSGGPGIMWTDLQLIQALKSMAYQNSDGEYSSPEHKETGDLLRDLIYCLMSTIIDKMPGTVNAGTW